MFFLKKRLNKKAGMNDLLLKSLTNLILLAIILAALLGYVRDVVTDKSFEKNFLARDISLTLDALYAAPNDAYVDYTTKEGVFTFDFKQNKVIVSSAKEQEDGKEQKPLEKELAIDISKGEYHFAEDEDIYLEHIDVTSNKLKLRKYKTELEIS